VQKRLGYEASVATTPVGTTNIIAITAHDTNPARARQVANAYADSYIKVRRTQLVNDLLAVVTEIQAKIDELGNRVALTDPNSPTRATLLNQQAVLQGKLNDLQVSSQLEDGGVRLADPAVTPRQPVSPSHSRDAALAGIFGLLLGLAAAAMLEYFDESIRTPADLDRAVGHALPTRAVIPFIGGRRDPTSIVSVDDPLSPAAESYRSLRTSLQYVNLGRPAQFIQITSPSEGEGKTTTLVNLGVAFANAGLNVALVCTDLRRPRLHELFGLDNDTGLTSVMMGSHPLSEAIRPIQAVPGLFVMSSGPPVTNPSEVLNTQRARDVFTSLRSQFGIVLFDCPPVLPVTDAVVLAANVDVTLLVAMAGLTTRWEVSRALMLLDQVNARVAGVVLNGLAQNEASQAYRYAHYQAQPTTLPNGPPPQPVQERARG
jgi:capsular exopolysaccharide synthesis family protein